MMANYKKVAEQILSTVGGAENVASVTHCMTRLRFNLKDESLSNDEKLEDISSIISVDLLCRRYLQDARYSVWARRRRFYVRNERPVSDPFPGGRCGVLLLPGVCRL